MIDHSHAADALALGLNALVQSTIIIAAGLVAALLVRRWGAAVGALVLRATLAALLVCPVASILLDRAGMNGLRISLAAARSAAPVAKAEAPPRQTPPATVETKTDARAAVIKPSPVDAFLAKVEQRADTRATLSHAPAALGSPFPQPQGKPAAASVEARAEAPALIRLPVGMGCYLLAGIWVIGSAMLLGRLWLAMRWLHRIRRDALPVSGNWIEGARRCAGLIGVTPPVVLATDDCKTPCLIGCRRPTILLPLDSTAVRHDVLLHELAHLKRNDCTWYLLARVTTALLWCQPLVWLLSRRLEQAGDAVCDDFVVAYGSNRAEYAHALLDMADRHQVSWLGMGCAAGIAGFRSSIAERVLRIMDNSRAVSIRSRRLTVLMILTLCAIGSVSVAMLGVCVPALAADPGKTAPTKPPTSIFDFGLEPNPNSDDEKGSKDPAAKPEPAHPASPAAHEDPKPAPAPPTPTDLPHPVQPPAPQSPPSPALPGALKEVVEAIHIDAQGVMTADRIVTLGLKGTEGQRFIVEGDLYPAQEPSPYNNGQVYFHLRHISGRKCINLSINGMQAKRLLFGGEMIKRFASPMKFEGIEREKWHHFKIEAGPDGLRVQLDNQQGEVKGPTETGGANQVVLGPGAKLRNVKIAVFQNGAFSGISPPPASAPLGIPAAQPAPAVPQSVPGVPAPPIGAPAKGPLSPPPTVAPPASGNGIPQPGVNGANPQAPPDTPRSPLAVAALGRGETATKQAEAAFRTAVVASRQICLKDLDSALKLATQAGNLEEANRIVAVQKHVSAQIDELNGVKNASAGPAPSDLPTTLRAAEALKRDDIASARAMDARALATLAAKRQCVKDLDAAIKASVTAKELDEANRIQRIKKQIEASMGAETTAVSSHHGKKYEGELFASGDDSFVLYINGEMICQGETKVVHQSVKIGPGDVIAVRAVNKRYEHGFACYIAFPNQKKSLISHTATWKVYTPVDELKWYDVRGMTSIKPALLGQDKYVRPEFEKVLQGDQEVLWGDPKAEIVYLALPVTEDIFREMKAIPPPKP